jgi:hypothetical protein
MKTLLKITFLFLISSNLSFAQKGTPLFSICGKTGDCTMTWEEFSKCKKVLVPTDKKITIGTFLVTVQKAERKDSTYIEFQEKGGLFSKSSLEVIEKLHKDKKLGNKIVIEAVEILESGKAARKGAGMVITLN